jgi:hypothetical protein
MRTRAQCPAEDNSASSGGPASVTAPGRRSVPGRCPPGIARRVGRSPLTVPHVAGRLAITRALRTDRRTAGLFCHVMGRTPSARLHTSGAVPGRQRVEEITSVGYHFVCPSGMPRTRSEAGARKGPDRRTGSAGRRPDRAGPPHESSLSCGPRAADVGPGSVPCRFVSARASLPSSPGHGPCQSGRRWGTDGLEATTSRSAGHAGGGRATRTAPPPGRGPGAKDGRSRPRAVRVTDRFVTDSGKATGKSSHLRAACRLAAT